MTNLENGQQSADGTESGADHARWLLQAIALRSATIGVIGLGYVGLPLARLFVESGYRTFGFDIDPRKIERLRRGESYIGHLVSGWIADSVREDRFRPTAEMRLLSEPDVILICVPTPLTAGREPDLSFVEGTARQIAETLRPGQLVVLESTTYPGTTREVVLPILAERGLVVEEAFFLAYSPEREDPGNAKYRAGAIPKVVGGIGPKSLRLAEALYGTVTVGAVAVSSVEVAEACKILENTYRGVNIALVNELKVLFERMGIDVWEVIDAAKTKPFGFQAFYPGPGPGGHCIPIDPFYLSWLARRQGTPSRFIELAGEVNTQMPHYVVGRTEQALAERQKRVSGAKICILGIAYKKDVDDPRESASFVLMDLLRERGAAISYNDPHVPVLPRMRHHNPPALTSQELTADFLAAQDCVLIATDHSAYDYEFIVRHARLVVDTRGATRQVRGGREKIVMA